MSKVAVIKCESYSINTVYDSIKKGINLIGGLNKFVKKGEKILLKPNLLFGQPPENACSTHPVIFEAVIKILQEYTTDITYGDSPGFGTPEQAAKKCGLSAVAQKYNVKLDNFIKGSTVKYPQGLQNKQFEIANAIIDSKCIINLPKMKTHQFMRITGAVKNLFGCIYGLNKPAFHAKLTNPVDFARMLVDLAGFVNARLHIMDGIVAMEGNGPSGGTPVKMNVILISEDPVALDSVFCKIIDMNPEFVQTNILGEIAGLGKYHDKDIQLVGDDINQFINKKFDVVRKPLIDHVSLLGKIAKIKNYIIAKPVINYKKCMKCFRCIDACPVPKKALNLNKGLKSLPPVYDYSICIRCYCCQEMCPYKAITVKTPLLGKLFLK